MSFLADSQLAQYIARLRLLEMGQLEAAFEITRISPTQAKGGNGDDAQGSDDEEGGAVPAETAAELIIRIEKFVQQVLRKPRQAGQPKDQYKDGLVFEERKKVLAEFAREGTRYKKCSRCLA